MKRLPLILALLAPGLLLLYFYLMPQADLVVEVPLAHFYVVTFTTFSAAVISILLVVSLGETARPRHLLTAAAFAVIGGLFFSHGLTTPGAIIANFHPAIQWSAWLTLFGGGLMFTLASFDGPDDTPRWLKSRQIIAVAFGGVILYSAIAAFLPQWLTQANQIAAPWHRLTIFFITLGLWLFAAYRMWRIWRVTGGRVDGALAFVALWVAQASISMHLFALNRLSWWLYHFILLGAFLFTAAVLIMEYENARQFRVQRYYLAASLVITALLALVTSHLIAEYSYRTLVAELEASSAQLIGTLTDSVAASLPPQATPADTRGEFIRRIAGDPLEMGNLRVYDTSGAMVFPPGQAKPEGAEAGEQTYFRQALAGETLVRIRPPGDVPEGYEPAEPVHLIETYTAIPSSSNSSEPVGILVTLQEAPELNAAILRGRATGLAIAALTMGLLFAALLLVVNRAEHILTSRTDELRSAYTALQESESIREDLTHMIVHDLRTPLSVITASLELLTRPTAAAQAEARARYVHTARAAGLRMTGLIDDLLNVARIEAGELEPKFERTQIATLFHENLSDFSIQAAEGRQFGYDCPAGLVADLDKEQMGRVLANLVGNAFKYTQKGGVIEVTAWAEAAEKRVYFNVRDNGEGIPDVLKRASSRSLGRCQTAKTRRCERAQALG